MKTYQLRFRSQPLTVYAVSASNIATAERKLCRAVGVTLSYVADRIVQVKRPVSPIFIREIK